MHFGRTSALRSAIHIQSRANEPFVLMRIGVLIGWALRERWWGKRNAERLIESFSYCGTEERTEHGDMRWEAVKAANIGGREKQQDRVGLFEARDGSARLLVLADGMGGHQGGELASKAVIDAASGCWQHYLTHHGPAEDFLRSVVQAAHDEINHVGEQRGIAPRSTVVALLAAGEHATWAHIGDSRIYRFRESTFLGRSHDHSVVQMLVDIGKVKETEMATHPDQNRLTRSLGGDRTPEPEIEAMSVEPGDGFLLCSDGLWEQVSEDEMAKALMSDDLTRAAKHLVGSAAKRGGTASDNVAMVLARATDRPPKAKRFGLFGLLGTVGVVIGALLLLVFLAGPDPGHDPDGTLTIPLPERRVASPGPFRAAKRLEDPIARLSFRPS